MRGDLISRKHLLEQYGLKDCANHGNETAEQRRKSYDMLMMYEIADMIEDAPTAYDIDVVVGKMEECEKSLIKELYKNESLFTEEELKELSSLIRNYTKEQIEIVRNE